MPKSISYYGTYINNAIDFIMVLSKMLSLVRDVPSTVKRAQIVYFIEGTVIAGYKRMLFCCRNSINIGRVILGLQTAEDLLSIAKQCFSTFIKDSDRNDFKIKLSISKHFYLFTFYGETITNKGEDIRIYASLYVNTQIHNETIANERDGFAKIVSYENAMEKFDTAQVKKLVIDMSIFQSAVKNAAAIGANDITFSVEDGSMNIMSSAACNSVVAQINNVTAERNTDKLFSIRTKDALRLSLMETETLSIIINGKEPLILVGSKKGSDKETIICTIEREL